MEIIKDGKDLSTIMYHFVCPECECEFRASREEIVDGVCNCPNCGEQCTGEKE